MKDQIETIINTTFNELSPQRIFDGRRNRLRSDITELVTKVNKETLNEFLQEVVELEQKFTKEPDDEDKPGYSLGKFAGVNIIKNRLVKLLEDK